MIADALGQQPVLARERLLDGRVWDVDAQEFELGGERIRREVIVHPGAVAVVALNDAGEVMLVHQCRHPAGGRGSCRRRGAGGRREPRPPEGRPAGRCAHRLRGRRTGRRPAPPRSR